MGAIFHPTIQLTTLIFIICAKFLVDGANSEETKTVEKNETKGSVNAFRYEREKNPKICKSKII